MTKTSIEEYLDQEKVSYEVFNFRKTDPTSFQEELKKRQIDPESIGKTLVLKGDKTGVIIAVIPWPSHLNYKKIRKFQVIVK
nr:YbaK/EbsC family protein [Enterococcus villorum]